MRRRLPGNFTPAMVNSNSAGVNGENTGERPITPLRQGIDLRVGAGDSMGAEPQADSASARQSTGVPHLNGARVPRELRDEIPSSEERAHQTAFTHRIEQLERELSDLRRYSLLYQASRMGPLATAAKLLGRGAFALCAAAATVPVAATLGVSAAAVEALVRAIPSRRRRDQAEAPRAANEGLATLAILNFNGRDLLVKNLPHCQAAIAHTGRPHEILVIDNGSTDGSVELLRERFPEVKVVTHPKNLFFSRGYQAGLHAAQNDFIVLLNNDMRVEKDFLAPLLGPFRDDDSVFAVASQILMEGKRNEETGLTRGRFVNGRLELRHEQVPTDLGDRPVPILWAGGGAAAFDRRKFEEIGGLDVLYDPFYCEDADLSVRAWRRGWKVLFASQSKVWHDHRTTSRRVFGEHFVNETVRRNMLLLQWVNLRDPDLMADHSAHLPLLIYDQVRQHGVSGARSLVRATARMPRVLMRRAKGIDPGPSVREILEYTDVGADPTFQRKPKHRSATDPLRIVMVAPYHLYPVQHGGAVRMYHVLKGLARRGHDVSLVGFVDTEEQREQGATHLREFCREVRLMVRGAAPSVGRWDPLPEEVRHFESATLRRELLQTVAGQDADVIQVEYTHMAPYLLDTGRAINCLTEHDVAFVSLYRQAVLHKDPAARRALRSRYLKMFRFELEAIRRFDVVFTVSAQDARLLRGYAKGKANISERAPIGADVERLAKLEWRPQGESVIFVGNFRHPPNVDAVRFFADRILPELWKRAPELKVTIVGSEPPEAIKHLAHDPRVTVAGFVDDLAPLYSSASAFIAPIRFGAGVRVKLLEAFAAGIPVVSTRVGAEGLHVEPGRELMVADDPLEFAELTLRVLRDKALAGRLAGAARALVAEKYGWGAIVEALEGEYQEALDRKLSPERSGA